MTYRNPLLIGMDGHFASIVLEFHDDTSNVLRSVHCTNRTPLLKHLCSTLIHTSFGTSVFYVITSESTFTQSTILLNYIQTKRTIKMRWGWGKIVTDRKIKRVNFSEVNSSGVGWTKFYVPFYGLSEGSTRD